MRINTNLTALRALRNLNETSDGLLASVNRLSTGLKITTSADDPAGLVTSEALKTQILGLEQASRNSQEAINMSKTAEGAISEIQTLLQAMRTIAVQSANTGVLDQKALSSNQAQIRSTIESIDRIAGYTSFGNKKLLDGTAGTQATVSRPDLVAGLYFGGTFNNHLVAAGPVTVNVTTQATRAAISTDVAYAAQTSILPAGNITINGVTIISTGAETLQQIVARINEASSVTNVTAQIVGSPGAYTVDLQSKDYGANYSVNLVDSSGLLNSTSVASSTGSNAVADVSVTTSAGVETVSFIAGRSAGESGLLLTDTAGNSVRLTEVGNAGLGVATQVGVLETGSISIQYGAGANQMAQVSIPSLFASKLGASIVPGQSVATLDVTTAAGASNAIRIIDEALSEVSRVRGELGSFQKDFLESNVRSLGIARENMIATHSQIRDVDIAEEMTENVRLQILQQSGLAVLAQANHVPQSVLQLLQDT